MSRTLRQCVADGARIGINDLDSSIAAGWIAASAVTEGKIGTGAVTNTKLGANAVTQAKISNLAWGTATCNPGKIAGCSHVTTYIVVSGATVGDAYVVTNITNSWQAAVTNAYCAAAGSITLNLANGTGGVVTPAQQTFAYFQVGA